MDFGTEGKNYIGKLLLEIKINTFIKNTKNFIKNTDFKMSVSDCKKAVLNNIYDLVEVKRKNNYPVELGVQFLLLDDNVHELINAVKLFKNLGADNIQIKPYSYNPNSLNKYKELQIHVNTPNRCS